MNGETKRGKLEFRVLDAVRQPHFFQNYELLYILEGTMQVTAEQHAASLRAEDILVINANQKYTLVGGPNLLFAQLSIASELVSQEFHTSDILFWCDSTREQNEHYAALRDTLRRLLSHYLSARAGMTDFGRIALCYSVLEQLSVHFLMQIVHRDGQAGKESQAERVAQIDQYIQNNYREEIGLRALAEKLYLSEGYLARYFKKKYQMRFADFLAQVRLYHAVEDLLYTDAAVTRIALDNGFSNATAMNRAFRKAYGKTPSEMRRKAAAAPRQAEEAGGTAADRRLENYMRRDGRPEAPAADTGVRVVRHCANAGTPLAFVWKRMVNIGAAEDLLRSEVREHLAILKEKLGFTYVRFSNIFTRQMLIDTGAADGQYNFSRLDSILDFLVAQNLKPHIELGQKPRRVQRTVQNRMVYEDDAVLFADSTTWDRFFERMLRHLVRRYGVEEVETWKLELWYDVRYERADEKADRYFELFDHTYEIKRRCCGGMELGGCGFQGDNAVGSMSQADFLAAWKSRAYLPDYISYMYFAYEWGEVNEESYSRRLTDNDGFLHKLQLFRAELERQGLGNKAVYVTEWNLSISDRNYINDTCFKGAYLVKNLMDAYDLVGCIGYFLGSDRVSEYYDSSQLLFGGMGLLTKDGILKPAAYAIEFLNRLYPYAVARGENYLITTNRHHSYGIVCHNQKRLNFNYYFTAEDKLERENLWKYYEDRAPLELDLRLSDLADGSYQLKCYRINEENGSVMRTWAEMEFEEELTRNDVGYLRRVCEPKLTIQKAEVTGGELKVDLCLAPNELLYIRVNRV